jgi:biopolymer transport protein ExbD
MRCERTADHGRTRASVGVRQTDMTILRTVAMALFLLVCGCAHRSNVTLLVRADGRVTFDGKVLSDVQLRHALGCVRMQSGAIPLIIRADPSLRNDRFIQLGAICMVSGFWKIYIGLPEGGSLCLYPYPGVILPCDPVETSSWDRVVDWDSRTIAVATNAGVNVIIEAAGALLDGIPTALTSVVAELPTLKGTARDRVLVRAQPDARFGDLLTTLKACESLDLNVIVYPEWGAVTLPAGIP